MEEKYNELMEKYKVLQEEIQAEYNRLNAMCNNRTPEELDTDKDLIEAQKYVEKYIELYQNDFIEL